MKPLVEVAYKEALEGKFWEALTLNGLFTPLPSGYNSSIAIDALAAGAVAAGLCGKGPAVTAVTPKDKVDSVRAAFQKYRRRSLAGRLQPGESKGALVMVDVIVKKTEKLSGEICAPPSKSYTQRMLIAAALSNGTGKVSNPLLSEDTEATLRAITALGCRNNV